MVSTFDETALQAMAVRAAKTLPSTVNGRIDKAVRLIQSDSVDVHDDGTATVLSESDGVTTYRVQGRSCACPDYTFQAPQGWCSHRIAVAMLQRLLEEREDLPVDAHGEEPETAVTEMAVADETLARPKQVDLSKYTIDISGKTFVQYAGLLARAHERGLTSLSARFISVTSELALAEATATFQDGRTFTEAADATPQNVKKFVQPHFARMALTRAKARCLRDALNIAECSWEELE